MNDIKRRLFEAFAKHEIVEDATAALAASLKVDPTDRNARSRALGQRPVEALKLCMVLAELEPVEIRVAPGTQSPTMDAAGAAAFASALSSQFRAHARRSS